MNKNTFTTQGFTLIEILLYMSLSVIMIALIGGVGVNILHGRVNAKIQEELQYNAQFLTEKLQILISQAEMIQSPTNFSTSSSLSLVMEDDTKNPTLIDVADGQLRIKEGDNEPTVIVSKDIMISNMEFANLTHVGGSGTVRITMGLSATDSIDNASPPEMSLSTTINLQYP